MNLLYIVFRIIRKLLPNYFYDLLLKRNILIKAGIETANPKSAFKRYDKVLRDFNKNITNKTILLFGYGGSFEFAFELLKYGAKKVHLYDKYKKAKHEDFDPRLIIIEEGINQYSQKKNKAVFDLVISSSVLEHIDGNELEKVIASLSRITFKNGIHIHFIDLRDHYFSYPFEMLCYSKSFWENFLNPPNNLNRFRVKDYLNIFEKYFNKIKIQETTLDIKSFKKNKSRIKAEFITGDDRFDSITQIALVAYRRK